MLKKLIKFSLILNAMILLGTLAARLLIRPEGDANSDEFARVAIMGSDRFRSHAANLRRGTVIAVMGGVELDLTDAHLAPGAEVTILAIWGGVDVRVPPKWRVVTEAAAYLGDVRRDVEGQADLPQDAPTLIVNARAVMGGIHISNEARTPVN